MNSIILRSDLRCPKKCDGRIIEKRGGFGKVEYLCDRCKIAVQPVPRMRLSEVDYPGFCVKGPVLQGGEDVKWRLLSVEKNPQDDAEMLAAAERTEGAHSRALSRLAWKNRRGSMWRVSAMEMSTAMMINPPTLGSVCFENPLMIEQFRLFCAVGPTRFTRKPNPLDCILCQMKMTGLKEKKGSICARVNLGDSNDHTLLPRNPNSNS